VTAKSVLIQAERDVIEHCGSGDLMKLLKTLADAHKALGLREVA
jgi:hypothetical protein